MRTLNNLVLVEVEKTVKGLSLGMNTNAYEKGTIKFLPSEEKDLSVGNTVIFLEKSKRPIDPEFFGLEDTLNKEYALITKESLSFVL